jgi:hypothetical protein
MCGDERMPITKRVRWTDYWPLAVVLVYHYAEMGFCLLLQFFGPYGRTA